MRLLLGSGGLSTTQRREAWISALDQFLGDIKSFVYLAYAVRDHDAALTRLKEFGLHSGRNVIPLHQQKDVVRVVRDAEAIFITGGNSFRLLESLYRLELIDPIRERVRGGVPYIGISAGTNMACPTLKTTNDMPIVQPPSFNALGFVPFQINPHYFSGAIYTEKGEKYGGETRDDRLREFHEMNETPVLALCEGAILQVEGNTHRLTGIGGARLFRKGAPVEEVPAGATWGERI